VQLWRQPVADPSIPRRLAIFLDGEFYLERMQTPALLEQLETAGQIPPLAAVYVSHHDGASRQRDFVCRAEYTRFLVEELIPWVQRASASELASSHLLVGLSLSGLAALFAAVDYPQVFSHVLAQSPSTWWNDEWFVRRCRESRAPLGRVWLSVGDLETDENVTHPPTPLIQVVSQLDSCQRLAAVLAARCTKFAFNTFHGGHSMECWREELPEALGFLLGNDASA
jgi:enterochelin esterase family protein